MNLAVLGLTPGRQAIPEAALSPAGGASGACQFRRVPRRATLFAVFDPDGCDGAAADSTLMAAGFPKARYSAPPIARRLGRHQPSPAFRERRHKSARRETGL